MSSDLTSAGPELKPRNVFGLRSDVRGNIQFMPSQEVIYPVAQVLCFHDYQTNKQRFMRLKQHTVPELIVMSPDKKWMAVAEKTSKRSNVNIYDMRTLEFAKKLQFPDEFPTKTTQDVCFTCDSYGLAWLSGEPNAFVAIFFFDRAQTVWSARVTLSTEDSALSRYVTCSPVDSTVLAVAGENVLKTFGLVGREGDKRFTTTSPPWKKFAYCFTSVIWLNSLVIIGGTDKSQLVVIQNKLEMEITAVYPAELVETIDLTRSKENVEEDAARLIRDHGLRDFLDVNCMTVFGHGFCYAIANVLHVFERETSYRFAKKTRLTIPVDIFATPLYQIRNVAVNVQMDTVIVTAAHNQIFVGMLVVPETLRVQDLEFAKLGEPLHIEGVVAMSVCSWKTIVMTAATDRTIRVWNYETGKVELVKKYALDIHSLALHPSSFFAAVGFSDQMRLMSIMLDQLRPVKTFNFPKCQTIEFAHEGHMLACGYDNLIAVVSVFSFDTIHTLSGDNGFVTTVQWSPEDEYLMSASSDGVVCQWRAKTGECVNEVVHRGTEYRQLAVTGGAAATYAITGCGLLREVAKGEVVREMRVSALPPAESRRKVDALTTLVLSRNELMMFVASEAGHLYSVKMPTEGPGGGSCTSKRFFNTAVTRMRITYNDELLATTSANGTLVIWSIQQEEGHSVAEMNVDLGKCVDVMVPRQELIDKNDKIVGLEKRIQQQIAEFQSQMELGDKRNDEAMREVHTEYCKAIDELKKKNEEMDQHHAEEINIATENISELKDEQAMALMKLEADFHEKIIIELDKSQAVKRTMEDMRESYEKKLRKSAGCLQDTIEALEKDFLKQLQERQELIRELMIEMESKKAEFVKFCKKVETDNDRKVVETKLSYEEKLAEVTAMMTKWRAEAGVLNKKYNNVSRNQDELESEKAVLRAEHYKTKKIIANLELEMGELKKEIHARDQTILDKEKRLNELIKKNQELEKYRLVLNHKIFELNEQIEPRERTILEKQEQIIEMSKEMEAMEISNQDLTLQLSELKDKYHSVDKELLVERNRFRASRSQVDHICGDIFKLSNFNNSPSELKVGAKKLFENYADDKSLRKALEQDADVENAYMRQREHLEKLLESYRLKEGKVERNNNAKLVLENVKLLSELNAVRSELKDVQRRAFSMEAILGVSGKYLPTNVAREKLAKACADFDELERRHAEENSRQHETIEALRRQNQELLNKIVDLESDNAHARLSI